MCSCSSNKSVTKSDCECNKERILKIAEKEAKRAGYKTDKLERKVTEEEDYFFIEYLLPKGNPLMRGGGCDFKISKKTCEVIDGNSYQ